MRRCTPTQPARSLQLIRRAPHNALPRARSHHHRPFSATRVARSQSSSLPPPGSAAPSQPTNDAKPAATESPVILRHSISKLRFIHITILGQMAVAWSVSPLILADEQSVLNPTAPYLAFGLPVWATAQWLVWRWFLRHSVAEVRTLPGPVYELDTLSRAFARPKTRVIQPADFVSRERVTAHTSILRVKNPKDYFLLNRRAEKLLVYDYDGVEEMLDPLPDQLALEAAAKAAPIEAEKRAQLEAKVQAAASEYLPFKREPKQTEENNDAEEKPKS